MIRIYDSRRQALVDFAPLIPNRVGMYVCGPTVQASPHIGHLRSALVYDLWRRWFEHRGYEVTLIRNVTDIDDKVLARAGEHEQWWALAYRMHLEFSLAYQRLGILPPTYEPQTSASIPQILEFVDRLIDSGHAYVADDGSGDVYFDVTSWERYGELTRQRLDAMGSSPDVETRGKRDPRDFALWKGMKASEPESASWRTPWGGGRPGWHIQCSTMAKRYLGAAFDIHGGGQDLRFPHHENELAQSHAVGDPFASYWMHNGLVDVGGRKMSRSMDNSVDATDLFASWGPTVIRYYLLSAHYRSTLDYRDGALDEAETAVRRIEGFLRRSGSDVATDDGSTPPGTVSPEFEAALDDDLNVPEALAIVHDLVRRGNTELDRNRTREAFRLGRDVGAMLHLLGLPVNDDGAAGSIQADERASGLRIERMLHDRALARNIGDFAASDRIRDELGAAGVRVEDSPTGSRWTIS